MPFAGPGYHERKQAPQSSQLVHDRAVCSAESQRNRQACTILYLHILTPGNLSQSIQLRDFQSTDYSRIATMIPDVTTHCSCMYVRSMLVKRFLNVKFDILMETLEIIKFHARMCTCKQQWIMHIWRSYCPVKHMCVCVCLCVCNDDGCCAEIIHQSPFWAMFW